MKTVLITGATDGIGRKTAELISSKGHRVLVHGRNPEKVQQLVNQINEHSQNKNNGGFVADFENFDSISSMTDELKKSGLIPNVLVNNAAVFEHEHVVLKGGAEKTFMVNYLAPYYLTRLLLPEMIQLKSPRIVNVSSMAQTGTVDFNNLMGLKKYDGYEAYALSKLANVLFTYKLHRLYAEKDLLTFCLHPGVINTKLLRAGWGMGGASEEVGARRLVFAAFSADRNLAGNYLVNDQPSRSAAISYDKRIQDRLWDISSRLCGLPTTE